MKFKVGDLVRVKPYDEIVKTGEYYPDMGIQSTTNKDYFFTDDMKKMCCKEYVIALEYPQTKTYILSYNNGWHKNYGFVKEWLEKI